MATKMKYSGVISKFNSEKLVKITEEILSQWCSKWLIKEQPLIEVIYQNERLYSGSSLSYKECMHLTFNKFLCCEFSVESLDSLSKVILGLKSDSILNAKDGLFISSFSQKLACSFSHILTKFTDEIQVKDKISDSIEDDLNVVLTIGVTLGVHKIHIHFSDRFLYLFGIKKSDNKILSPILLSPNRLIFNELSNEKLKCSITLDSNRITLGELLKLKVGHVIKLQHPLSQPLALKSNNKITPLKGFLVKNNNQKSIYF